MIIFNADDSAAPKYNARYDYASCVHGFLETVAFFSRSKPFGAKQIFLKIIYTKSNLFISCAQDS